MIDAFTRAFHAHFTRDPNWNVHLGVDRLLDRLPDPSLAEAASRVEEARGLLRDLEGVRAGGASLPFDDALDLDLAGLLLEAEIHRETLTFNGRTHRQQCPTAGDDIGAGLFTMLMVNPRPAADRLADIAARIRLVPDHLEMLLARLDTPVARWVAIDLEESGGLPMLFATIREWAERERWPDAAALAAATRDAEAALTRYHERLHALPTTPDLAIGDEQTRRLVALMGIGLTLEDLHALARDFLARTNDAIETLRGRLVGTYGLGPDASAKTLHDTLNERFRVVGPGGDVRVVLERYERERERALAFVREHDLFPIPESQDMKIVKTPEFLVPTIPAGAMNQPAPFRPGVRTSIVFLTLTPETVADHTELDIPGMMMHEGIPGHHLQLAWASLHPSVIRRHVNASDHAEGWTTMLEDYMLDAGYMSELEDEARFVGQRDIARLGARVAIDLCFMTGDRKYLDVGVPCDLTPEDPFTAAGNLLTAVTGFSPPRTHGELSWYSLERGTPLTYLTGNKLVWDLKRDVTTHAARRDPPLAGLDLDRAFHRIYLESGNMPVRYLRRVYAEHGLLPTADRATA